LLAGRYVSAASGRKRRREALPRGSQRRLASSGREQPRIGRPVDPAV